MSTKSLRERLRETGKCTGSDRDVPGLVCGYPLPCPYHTYVVDLDEGGLEVPENRVGDETAERLVLEVAGAIKAGRS